MRKARSLVIAPFDAPGQRVLDTARRALTEIGIDVWHLSEVRPGADWAAAVTDAIRTSDFVVADVTRQNPNVLYEVGYAHALQRPTILMVNSEAGKGLPSDLAGFQYIVYDLADLSSLAGHLKRAASAFVMKEALAG